MKPPKPATRRLLRKAAGGALAALVEGLKAPLHVDPDRDPYQLAFAEFFARINERTAPRVLELGARARSGNVYRNRLRPDARYVGLDIARGPNVDVVGDAHQLGSLFKPGAFDAVYSVSVFEHLAMPWVAARAMNEALATGGLLFVATHPTWPPHEEPWDFFRFQPGAFRALFNAATGFRLLRCSAGLPCRIVPLAGDPPLRGLWRAPAYLGVAAIAEKIGAAQREPSLTDVMDQRYPR